MKRSRPRGLLAACVPESRVGNRCPDHSAGDSVGERAGSTFLPDGGVMPWLMAR